MTIVIISLIIVSYLSTGFLLGVIGITELTDNPPDELPTKQWLRLQSDNVQMRLVAHISVLWLPKLVKLTITGKLKGDEV